MAFLSFLLRLTGKCQDRSVLTIRKMTKRMTALAAVMSLLFGLLAYRFYSLQILQGQQYRDAFLDQIERTENTAGIRGNIYDRNGRLLAYNERTWQVSIEDNGVYAGQEERNRALNRVLARVVEILEENGDDIEMYLPMEQQEDGMLAYTWEGSRRLRFLAEVYGHSSAEELAWRERDGYDEREATCEQVLAYLGAESMYGIGSEYTPRQAWLIASLRYAMSQNRYQRYVDTLIADEISESAMAAIAEGLEDLPGIVIGEVMKRRYNDSLYLAHILGYTGPVTEEMLQNQDPDAFVYEAADQVGIIGMEQVMEETLRGEKGVERFWVDSLGRRLETLEKTEAQAGKDVYLTIDAALQKTVYNILEQELAGILLGNMREAEEEGANAVWITPDEVFFALIDNQLLDTDRLDGMTGERLARLFSERLTRILEQWEQNWKTPYGLLPEEMQGYQTYALSLLSREEIIAPGDADRDAEEYLRWEEGEGSAEEYVGWLLSQGLVDASKMEGEREYLSGEQLLKEVTRHLLLELADDPDFEKRVWQVLIEEGQATGAMLCMALMEQGFLPWVEEEYTGLREGTLSAFSFIREKIRNLEITPAQLALDPCTASSVVVDVQTGEVLACVTYPGYDNNRLANELDGEYYTMLLQDGSLPLYNNATQQRTAPGSTFKPLMAAAALTEGLIGPETEIEDRGIFTDITPSPRCWIYPGGTHGSINVSEALRDSCNYFFYRMGYQMSQTDSGFSDAQGIGTITRYAGYFGLGENTGIEIGETAPHIADEYPVTAAIGQSNHSFTTTQLARYAAALASRGNLYSFSLVLGSAEAGKSLQETGQPRLAGRIEEIGKEAWDAVAAGMRMVGEENPHLSALGITAAGKTGTAQQVSSRPNHALFIGYAPAEQPQIAIATRIAYGYSSSNAAEASADILRYYFGLAEETELVTRTAQAAAGGNAVMD